MHRFTNIKYNKHCAKYHQLPSFRLGRLESHVENSSPDTDGLARIFHSWIEQRGGEGVRRLEITKPNDNTTRRLFLDRL